jgi:hypothetical protein
MIDPQSVDNKIIDRTSSGKPKRSDTKLVIQHVLAGLVDAQNKYADEIVSTLLEVMADPKSRQRVDAAKALAVMIGDTAKAYEMLDKIERLDENKPTDNIGLQIIFEEARKPE